MDTKNLISKTEDEICTYITEFSTDNDYVYFYFTWTSKKGTYLDIITEQTTRILPEILAKQIFWDRIKNRVRTEVTSFLNPILNKLGINNAPELFGEPELKLSNTFEHGSGLAKFFAAISYNFHYWVLIGFTVTFRVKK